MDNGRERPGVADSANGREANGTGDPTIDCDPVPGLAKAIQRIGVAADHGGFELAQHLIVQLRALGHDVFDFGDRQQSPDDDYPDFVIPLAYGVARRDMERGIAICGSGVGASVAANKVPGVRACLIHETFSAHQGVEDDDLNLICLGGLVVGHALALELVQTFLAARFSGAERHCRRLAKIADLESNEGSQSKEQYNLKQPRKETRYGSQTG